MTATKSFTAQRAQGNIVRRLKSVEGKLAAFDARLAAIHADRSGTYRAVTGMLQLVADQHGYQNIATSIARIEREAFAGCLPSAAWLVDTAAMRERVECGRKTLPPERDPEYAGPPVWPFAGLRESNPHRW